MIARLQKWALWLALLAAIAIAGHWALNRYEAKFDAAGFDRADQMHKLQNAKDVEQRLIDQLQDEADAAQRLADETAKVNRLSGDLIKAKAVIDTQAKKLKERANDVSTLYRSQQHEPLNPVPAWLVTNGWVCDYNRAIGYGGAEDGTDIGGDAGVTCAADPFGRNEVSATDILVHHQEYGAYCRKLEQQVNTLLDHALKDAP